MNPFVLNKMHGAFVPDRLTDIAATTPAVSPEPTVQPRHTHIEAGTDLNDISTMGYYVGASQQPPIVEKTIAVSIYRFDVAHRGDIAMLMADGDAVQVTCGVVVEDDCRGVDMLSHVFGFAVMPKMAVFIEHDGSNTQRVMETLSRLYYEENPLLFVVVTHADLYARVKLISKSLVFMNLGARDYGCKGVIYFNEDMAMRIMAHEQGRDRHPTLDRAVQHIQITPIVDTEYYRHLRQNMGLPTKPTTESHALRISELSDHLHPSSVGNNRTTMAVNYVNHQRIKQRVDVGELVVRHSLRTMDLALPNVYKSTK